MGKVFDLSSGTLENRSGMLRGLVRLWLLLVLGLLNRKRMERLLALRPSAGPSPFLAKAYCWKHVGDQLGSTCAVETPANCHLFCFCATAVCGEGPSASTAPRLLE